MKWNTGALGTWAWVPALLLGAAGAAPADITKVERAAVSSTGVQPNDGSSAPVISADGRYVAFVSNATNLVGGDTRGLPDVFIWDRVRKVTERVSVSSSGAEADGPSAQPSISADGRYVAFHSTATNLVPGDTKGFPDVFVRDRIAGTTVRVSVSSAGAEADGASASPSISGDGSLVAFQSDAKNLVGGDLNNATDIFVRDVEAGTTERVSLSSSGAEAAGASTAPSMSADGSTVAYASTASNLVTGGAAGVQDVYVRDRDTRATERISVSSSGAAGNASSYAPSVSGDGRYVAFHSDAGNLVTGDSGYQDVFVRDRVTRATERASVSTANAQATGNSAFASISEDGRYVLFQSTAPNLVSGDTNNLQDVFVRTRALKLTERVSVTYQTRQTLTGLSQAGKINTDGRVVTFISAAKDLVTGDTNDRDDVFLVDRATGVRGLVQYEKVNVTSSGLQFGTPVLRHAVGVKVEAVSAATGAVLGSAYTDASGNYRILLGSPGTVYVRVLALNNEKATVVRPSDGAVYAIYTSNVTVPAGSVWPKHVRANDSNRASGPFNILATLRTANALLRAADRAIVIPAVTVRWAADYRDGTYFLPSSGEIFINGDRETDSDEFDDAVVAHEYGHLVAHRFSRDENPGGPHALGDAMDPRLAWSEGWATFFGCACLNNPVYMDALGANGASVFTFNVEEDRPAWDNPGYWSEFSVSSALWDFFDTPADSTSDTLALGFKPVWTAVAGGLKNHRYVYLIDFCDVLTANNVAAPSVGSGIAAALSARSITYTPGAQPSVPNPFPLPIASGETKTGSVDSITFGQTNMYSSSAFYTFTKTTAESAVALEMLTTSSATPATADLDLILRNGDGVGLAISGNVTGVGGTERINANLGPGTFVVEVRSYYYDSAGEPVFHSGDFQLRASY